MPPIEWPAPGEDRPAVTVVLVATARDESVRNVVRSVRRQTIATQIELIVIATTAEVAGWLVALDPDQPETLGWTRTEALGRPIEDVDAEAAHGIRLARAPVTAVIEDHAYPAPD